MYFLLLSHTQETPWSFDPICDIRFSLICRGGDSHISKTTRRCVEDDVFKGSVRF